MAGLDPRINSEDRPAIQITLKDMCFLLLDGPIKPGHDESSLLAARTFAPVTLSRSKSQRGWRKLIKQGRPWFSGDGFLSSPFVHGQWGLHR
jgi:hypothetical protein